RGHRWPPSTRWRSSRSSSLRSKEHEISRHCWAKTSSRRSRIVMRSPSSVGHSRALLLRQACAGKQLGRLSLFGGSRELAARTHQYKATVLVGVLGHGEPVALEHAHQVIERVVYGRAGQGH